MFRREQFGRFLLSSSTLNMEASLAAGHCHPGVLSRGLGVAAAPLKQSSPVRGSSTTSGCSAGLRHVWAGDPKLGRVQTRPRLEARHRRSPLPCLQLPGTAPPGRGGGSRVAGLGPSLPSGPFRHRSEGPGKAGRCRHVTCRAVGGLDVLRRIPLGLGAAQTAAPEAAEESSWSDAENENDRGGEDSDVEEELGNSIADFTRFYEDPSKGVVELQTAIVSYWKRGPWWDLLKPEVQVDLVSVVHVGDPRYYERLQEELYTYDRVLYEMVTEKSSEEKQQQQEGVKAQDQVDRQPQQAGISSEQHKRAESQGTDSWAGAMGLVHAAGGRKRHRARASVPALTESPQSVCVERQGSLVVRRGDGSDATAVRTAPRRAFTGKRRFVPRKTTSRARRRRGFSFVGFMQRLLARSMGLSFQLDFIDYQAPTFKNADLDYDTFARLQKERSESIFSLAREVSVKSTKAVMATVNAVSGASGAAMEVGGGPFRRLLLWAARSLPMPLVGLLLIDTVCHPPGTKSGFLEQPAVKALFNLDVASALKVFLAQQMGSDVLDTAASIMEESVIVGERNKVAMEELHKALDDGCRRIAIFYGSAHLPDLHRRLKRELGLRPVAVQWLTAWSILGRHRRRLQSGEWEEVLGLPDQGIGRRSMAYSPSLRASQEHSSRLLPWLPIELPQSWPLSRYQTIALLLLSLILAVDLWLWELLLYGFEHSVVQLVVYITNFLDKGWSL